MRPSFVAWSVCLLPLFCIHASWIWSASVGAIPWCNPYWDGCASISRAARSSDALFLFRAVMIFTAAWLIIYWRLCGHFLEQKTAVRHPYGIVVFGYLGALFLILYADFLGTEGAAYRLMRRYGVIFFFTFTVLAQYMYTRRLLQNTDSFISASFYLRLKLGLGLVILIIGFVSLGATIALENPAKDRWENTTEWWFALGMMTYFGISASFWHKQQFRLT